MIQRRRELIHALFHRLLHEFGPQHWWPAETPFEMIVGAILTQNTAWKNVQHCIEVLREKDCLSLEGFCGLSAEELAPLIRSSGYYNQKARRLKGFCEHVLNFWQGDLSRFLGQDLENLRDELLSIGGIGPETADSIVLYAALRPSFVVDAYTHRVFFRHGWVQEDLGYEGLRDYFMECLEPDVSFFQEFHALLVRTGHLYCKRKPSCHFCPLEGWGDFQHSKGVSL